MLDTTQNHAARCVQEAVEYNKNRWDKTHKEPEFNIGDRVLISTLNFNNLGGNKKLKTAFIGPFIIKQLHGKNAVEVILSEEFSRKHPVFPVSLIKKYEHRNGSTNMKVVIPPLEKEEKHSLKIHKILRMKKERIQGKDVKLYLIRYKNQSADKDEWLPENNIPDSAIHLRDFRASNRMK